MEQEDISFENYQCQNEQGFEDKNVFTIRLSDSTLRDYYQDRKNSTELVSSSSPPQYSRSNESKQMEQICVYKEKLFGIQGILHQSDKQLNIYTGLSITDDGVIRLYSHINQVCFGLQQQQVIQIEEIPRLNVINIKQCRDSQQVEHSIEQAINFLNHVPNLPHKLVHHCFQKTGNILSNLKKQLMQKDLKYQEDLKNEEFERYIRLFFQYLDQYNILNPYKMYYYSIGRLNLKYQDMEYYHTGYSKSYLDFLGMDQASLSQIILRKKRVDLIRNKLDITNQALQGLSLIFEHEGDEEYDSYITTFDGFPIKVSLKRRNHTHIFGLQPFIGKEYEYDFVITEIDVDIYDLQQLIQYRERICKSEDIAIDDFLRRELSYLFEDVEYTIQSFQFIEKFYSNNLNTLNQIALLKKQDYSKVCGYRSIKS